MTKEQKQIAWILAMLPVLAVVVLSGMKRKKVNVPVAAPQAHLTLVDAEVKVPAPVSAAADRNALETQKKRAEAPWGRDPFSSDTYKSGQANSELKLQGISCRKDKVGFAFINNEIVKKGDIIGGYEVGEVLKDKVLLKKGSQSFYLTFPEE
ncbi:MAG: hypothetical protein NTY14_07100 [Candidatus Omnitrophica bacterium]|nr:hypothetical protein [Candidatus Omnitrophota bacterium]